jgi:glyoxylase-like metal-dependent hydrolase (beta-lactamase superfamily II)
MGHYQTVDPMKTLQKPALPRSPYDVTDDVAGYKSILANLYFVGKPGAGTPWVLVDAGMPGSAQRIREIAAERYGVGHPPAAIVLTHGHFDHVGSLEALLKSWDVPVYTHPLELPYLTGKSCYPPPDPGIGGGLMSYLSWVFPTRPLRLGDRVKPFPADGTIPGFEAWQVIHTPGHAPGHVSFFRERDRTLIAGDAFVTTNQNSARAVMTQQEELHGPPAYFTCDWEAARESVQKLAALNPAAVGTGHGHAIRGEVLTEGLTRLANEFDRYSIPSASGRYVREPARTDEEGVVAMPTPISYYVAQGLAVAALGLLAGAAWMLTRKKEK